MDTITTTPAETAKLKGIAEKVGIEPSVLLTAILINAFNHADRNPA